MASGSQAVVGATIESTSSTSKSCSNASVTNLLSIHLPCAGVWMLSGYVQINDPSASSGVYVLCIDPTSNRFNTGYYTTTVYSTDNNVPARLSVSAPYVTTGATTLYLNIYQSSGSSKTATYRGIKATRIA